MRERERGSSMREEERMRKKRRKQDSLTRTTIRQTQDQDIAINTI